MALDYADFLKPWFLESDKEISNKYFNLINLIGEESKGLARA
jgi:hypothetical protein